MRSQSCQRKESVTPVKLKAKEIADLLRTLSKSANTHHKTAAVVAAAGLGSRMGRIDGKTKQMMVLDDMPVIVRTLLAFEACPCIDEIIVSAKEDEVPLYRGLINEYRLTKVKSVVVGGDTRQESVLNGFEAVSDDTEFVAIHDGARCLILPEQIESVIRAAYGHGAATAACPATDTVKRVNTKGYIEETIDRSTVWLAQTPQVFTAELYRVAAYVAKSENFAVTDDNMMVEHIGYPVKPVDCGKRNIKLTTPEDISIAEAILQSRK